MFDSILEEMQAERDAAEGKPSPPLKSAEEQRRLDAAKELLRSHTRNEPRNEEERQRRIDERLAELGYTRASLDEARSAANRRNYRNGRYHNDRRQLAGSPDNPVPVGMEGCSYILFFDIERRAWKLRITVLDIKTHYPLNVKRVPVRTGRYPFHITINLLQKLTG